MNADTTPGLAEIINRQLGLHPDTQLAGGAAVRPEVLWGWVQDTLEVATARIGAERMAAE
ncbi:MAG: hypothetical protein ACRYG8_15755 [Janthinobacterium lividum]